nr:MAG TPA: hypothetical protein [Caudoviricetes sp.]
MSQSMTLQIANPLPVIDFLPINTFTIIVTSIT